MDENRLPSVTRAPRSRHTGSPNTVMRASICHVAIRFVKPGNTPQRPQAHANPPGHIQTSPAHRRSQTVPGVMARRAGVS